MAADIIQLGNVPGRNAERQAKIELLTQPSQTPAGKHIYEAENNRFLRDSLIAGDKRLFNALLLTTTQPNLTQLLQTAALNNRSEAFQTILNKAVEQNQALELANSVDLLEWVADCGQLRSLRSLFDLSTLDVGNKKRLWKLAQEQQKAIQTLRSRSAEYRQREFEWIVSDFTFTASESPEQATKQLRQVLAFIRAGVNVNAADGGGRTVLHYTTDRGHANVVNALILAGANVNVTERIPGETPLHWAADKGHINIVNTLIQAGADVNAADTVRGYTALHKAVNSGHGNAVNALIDAGANVNAVDRNNYTPLKLALAKNHHSIAQILRQHGAKE